jgi:hypothetical protein
LELSLSTRPRNKVQKRLGLVARGVCHFRAGFVFLLEGSAGFRNKFHKNGMKVGSGEIVRPKAVLGSHQLAFDIEKRAARSRKMNRYNGLKLQVLSLFAATQGEWLGPNKAAEKLDFAPARAAWTYFKRLWSFGLLERRSRGRGTLEYRISDLGRARLRWLKSHSA